MQNGSIILQCHKTWDQVPILHADFGGPDGSNVLSPARWKNYIFETVPVILAGWWCTFPNEKYEVNWDDEIPKIWKNKKCSKPPTSYEHFSRKYKRLLEAVT